MNKLRKVQVFSFSSATLGCLKFGQSRKEASSDVALPATLLARHAQSIPWPLRHY